MQNIASTLWTTFQSECQCMKGVVFMQDGYQGKSVLSGIWEDNCIMAHQNAKREPIFADVVDLQP